MSRASFIRSFLLRGTGVLIGTLSLLCMGWHNSESTGLEASQPQTTTSTTSTTTTSGTTTTSSTTASTTTTSSTTTTQVTTTAPQTTTTTQLTTVAPQTTTTTAEPVTTTTIPAVANTLPVSAYEYDLLCKIVCSEYGGMPDVYERAKIVASVMNQSARLHKSIEDCLYQTCVPWGFNIYGTYFCGVHYTAMADAVDYYFANRNTVFAGWDADSWYGRNGVNVFHRQIY